MTEEVILVDKAATEFRLGLKQRLYNWNMRIAREVKGWRQADLANASGIGAATISQIETLRYFPKRNQAERIAEVLGQTIESLFPEWLKEFKLKELPKAIEDRCISLEEAIKRHLIAPELLLETNIGWGETPEDIEKRVGLGRLIPEVLETLTPRERKVIELRFGLDDGGSRTLAEVGGEFNITRDRIRQIEAKALRKLRHPIRSRKLKDFLD